MERAQLAPTHAQRIVGITGDGDQGLIALSACQAQRPGLERWVLAMEYLIRFEMVGLCVRVVWLMDKRFAGLSFLLTLTWACAVTLVFWIYSLD